MATRFYLPSTDGCLITPTPDAAWDDIGSLYDVLYCVTEKISSAMTNVEVTDNDDQADGDYLIFQWIGPPMAAQTIQEQIIKIQMRGSEFSANNNLHLSICIRVVSNDGTSVTGTLVELTRDTLELTTTLTNRSMAPTCGEVEAEENDRICIEVGQGGDPSPQGEHDGILSIGDDSGTDLPENDTETTAYNPWIEFANDISWPSAGVSVEPVAVSAVGAVVNPTYIAGSLNIGPAVVTSIGTVVNPTAIAGSLTLSPAEISAIGAVVDPDYIAGSLTLGPYISMAVAGGVDPTVDYGSLLIEPVEISAVGAVVDPSVSEGGGNIEVEPAPASGVGTVVDPVTIAGSLNLTLTAIEAIGATVDPLILYGSLVIEPGAIVAIGTVVNPTVIGGEGEEEERRRIRLVRHKNLWIPF